MVERDYQVLWPLPSSTRFPPGTSIEIDRDLPKKPPLHALFDFDGTLSPHPEGWMDVMVPMLAKSSSTSPAPGKPRPKSRPWSGIS